MYVSHGWDTFSLSRSIDLQTKMVQGRKEKILWQRNLLLEFQKEKERQLI